jgi:hypothetical protein
MYTGPHIIKDGLVFGYDTGYGLEQHSGTRHYKGEPATNLITSGLPGYFGSGGETLYRDNYFGLNSDSGVFQRNYVNNPATANTSAFNNNAGLYKAFNSAALSSSTEYVLVSFDFYMITPYVRHSSSGTGLNGYMGIAYTDGTNQGIGWNTSLAGNAGDDWNNNSAYIGKWRKIGLYVQVNSSKTPSSIASMYIYNDRTVTGEGIFTNFVITEHVTVPTGPINYTSGTRSATQSLIDLKETTNIDVSNVSFDSTGQPDFDGSSDHIDLGTALNSYGSVSIELVFKTSTSSDLEMLLSWGTPNSSNYSGIAIGNWAGGMSDESLGVVSNGQTLQMWVRNGHTAYKDGNYHHAIVTLHPGQNRVFVDGIEQTVYYQYGSINTDAGAFTISNNQVSIGKYVYNSASRLNGKLPLIKIYNKALSDAEVKQNYNAYKNRFSI